MLDFMKLDILKKQTSNTLITQAYHSRCSSRKLSSKAKIAWDFWTLLRIRQGENQNDAIRNRISDFDKRRREFFTSFIVINIIFKLSVTNNRKYFLMTFLMNKRHNVCFRHHWLLTINFRQWSSLQPLSYLIMIRYHKTKRS